MRNSSNWRPSKYVYRNGKLSASGDPDEVGIGSRLNVDLIAGFYAAYLQRYARGKLLDLGCGKVPLYQAYKELITDNICVDWEHSPHGGEYLDYACDLTQDLPFGDGAFDTIILSDVLEHIPEPMHLWKEMSRTLADGGTLFMNVPFYYWIHEQPQDFYRYTEFALRRFTCESGLQVIHLDSIGGAPEVLADICAKNILHAPVIGRPFAQFIQWLAGLCIKSGFGKKLSDKTKQEFPLGYFLVAQKQFNITPSCCR